MNLFPLPNVMPESSLWKKHLPGKFLYATIFCLIIPGILLLTGHSLEPYINLKPVYSPLAGGILSITGLVLIVSAMIALRVQGGGLPMNGFPPPRFVAGSVYKLVPHPIYTGFILMVVGISIAAGSSAGLYVISPLSALGCMAIIWGYEKHDLLRRFGKSTPKTLFSLPPDNGDRTSFLERIRVAILVYGLWFVVYSFGSSSGVGQDAPSCRLFGEELQPVLEWAGYPYISIYPVAALFSLSLATNKALRCFAKTAIPVLILGLVFFFLIPLSGPPLPFEVTSWGGYLLQLDRTLDASHSIAFPSYHVLWGIIFLGVAIKLKIRLPLLLLLGGWLLIMSWSCVATGMHGWLDLAGSLVVYLLAENLHRIWRGLLHFSSRLANSWTQYRLGPLRIINHSLYAFLAASLGFYFILALAGPASLLPALLIMACSLVGSALWAQLIEGSSQLLRPFGYYGAILGGVVGILLTFIMFPTGEAFSIWVLFAAFAAGSPWIQAIGRLRCLVQGCCHGRPVDPQEPYYGIRHSNPSSRVCCLTPHKNIPLYPTPLYSIVFNLMIGILLLRLWLSHTPAGLIIGLYFILSGLSRFVEEAYRGEPQTRKWLRLSEYQWFSVALVAVGFLFLNIQASMVVTPTPVWFHGYWWTALLAGILYAFCMGMDFPDSHKRFSRLTG